MSDNEQFKGRNEKFQALLNEGPKTLQELPGGCFITFAARSDGISKFAPFDSGGSFKGVYYIERKHTPEIVLEEWARENETLLESRSSKEIHSRIRRYGDDWREASLEMFDPFSDKEGTSTEKGGICSLCGGEYSRDLRDHLPCDSSGSPSNNSESKLEGDR